MSLPPPAYFCFHFSGKFNWKGNIKAILRASPDQELAVKKLRKKVLFTDGTLPVFEFKVECTYTNSLCLYSFRFWQPTTLSLVMPILKHKRTCLHFSTRRSAAIQNLVLRKNEFDFWNRYFNLIHLTWVFVVHRLWNAKVFINAIWCIKAFCTWIECPVCVFDLVQEDFHSWCFSAAKCIKWESKETAVVFHIPSSW